MYLTLNIVHGNIHTSMKCMFTKLIIYTQHQNIKLGTSIKC
jgi:hypothetical protein